LRAGIGRQGEREPEKLKSWRSGPRGLRASALADVGAVATNRKPAPAGQQPKAQTAQWQSQTAASCRSPVGDMGIITEKDAGKIQEQQQGIRAGVGILQQNVHECGWCWLEETKGKNKMA